MTAADPRVDAYLAALPAEQQAALQHVRDLIGGLLPDGSETISYGMPTFKSEGQLVMSFAGWKDHCALYPLTGSFLDVHAELIAGFDRTKGSVHFTAAKPLPDAVIEELVATRLADLRAGRR